MYKKKIITIITLSFTLLGLNFTGPINVEAHQDPEACNTIAIQQYPSVNPGTIVHDGDTLAYTIKYTNIDPDLNDEDTPCNVTSLDADLELPDGSTINVLIDATLNVGETINCPSDPACAAGPYEYTVDHEDENESNNNVTAYFTFDGTVHRTTGENTAGDEDNLSTLVIHPSTVLTKSVDKEIVEEGEEVTFTYTEYNDGDVSLQDVYVEDDLCSPVEYVSGDVNGNDKLDPEETWTFTCTTNIYDTTTNVAIGYGLDPLAYNVTWCEDPENPDVGVFCDQDERDELTVTVVFPLLVEKIANTQYYRDWDWTIQKTANYSELTLSEGQTMPVNYEVSLSAQSEDYDHLIYGTILITNPSDNVLEADVTTVTDVLEGFDEFDIGDCDEELPYSLEPGESLECKYSIGVDQKYDYNEVYVATSNEIPDGYDDTDVEWGEPIEITDECVQVYDDNENFPENVIICENDLDKTVEYTVTFGSGSAQADVMLECGETPHPNVAYFVTNDNQESDEDSWNVDVTVECDLGCTLTQGYWKTHSEYGKAPYDDNWAQLTDGADTELDDSGMSWYEVFWTPPKGGDPWYQLAHQWMAAKLNALNGAYTPVEVVEALEAGENWLETKDPGQKLKGKEAKEPRTLASTLASYNEGDIGPGHCDDDTELD